jgi:hypothetical protein
MKRAVTQYCRAVTFRIVAMGFTSLTLLIGCGGPEAGPEQQLRQWVGLGQEAAEAKERRELVDLISPAYADARGNERDDIGKMLRVYFFRQNKIKLLTSIEDIRIYGDSAAEIDLTVGMAGTNEGVFGFSADAYQFELELEREGSDWLLISARWGELGEELN